MYHSPHSATCRLRLAAWARSLVPATGSSVVTTRHNELPGKLPCGVRAIIGCATFQISTRAG